jgi:hypothetical protein
MADVDAVIITRAGCLWHPSFAVLSGVAANVDHRASRTIFVLDSRHYSGRYAGTIRKLNEHEAARQCGSMRGDDEVILDAEARAARRRYGSAGRARGVRHARRARLSGA